MSPRIRLALATFFVCLCPWIANAQTNQIKGYAVQVAALSSQQSADELVRGLNTRGIKAYWVRGASYGAASKQGQFHRVRIGNFPTIQSAYDYAEKLLGSGLLDAYAIAAYEPPAKGGVAPTGTSPKVQTFAQKYQGKQFGGEAIDMIASIGTRGWLLLSSKSVNLTLQQGLPTQQGNSALSRELARMAASVGSRGWGLQNTIAKLFAAPAPLPANSAARVDLASNNSFGQPAVENIVSAKKGTSGGAPSASTSPLITAGPDIGRGSVSPAISTGVAPSARTASSKIYASPPRLQGSIEMRDGRMWMKLRNTDTDRSFSGMARVTLSDDKNQQDVTPMQFTLAPDQEESFPVDEATLKDGNWILMVYDQAGAARLVRGASLAPKPSPQAPGQAPGAPNPANSVEQNSTAQGPPSYVTGVYDATGWVNQPAPSPIPDAGQQNAPAPVPDAANSQNSGASAPASPATPIDPGQVSVTPRQIAVTTENVTLEFEISAPSPLNYIIVTLRAGDFQDARQALMSTPQGRVPFLVPAQFASGGFFYEVKDEAQRVLSSGNGDFRRLSRGN